MQLSQSMPALRILLVDDDAQSLSALGRLLRRTGHDVREAPSIAEAFRLALADPPELLLSDLDLPDGDGCELLRRLRALHPHVRAVAVSGFTGAPHEQRCRDAGYERLLVKPLLFEQVLSALDGVRPLSAGASSPAPIRPVS
jgi:CheY-like chemotaxis protein